MDDTRRQRVLRQHVRTDQLLGVDAVPRGTPAVAAAQPARSVAAATPPPVSVAATTATPASAVGESRLALRLPALSTDDKSAALAAMEADEVRGCRKCGLCQSRTQTVFGEGDPDAAIMFIGEGPGQTEDEVGRPFVGRAGELLDKMIVAMGLKRDDVFIANVVKCRPPGNRTPTPMEAEACWPYLQRQVAIVQPKAIVTLGGPATKMILGTSEGITRLRGTWGSYAGVEPAVPVMPTFHPAYVLRNYTKDTRQKVWDDLQKVMQRVRG
jgi:uracil-DNA glycosylase family 4